MKIKVIDIIWKNTDMGSSIFEKSYKCSMILIYDDKDKGNINGGQNTTCLSVILLVSCEISVSEFWKSSTCLIASS